MPNFRNIVDGFTSSGVMTEKIIEFVTEANASKIIAKQNMASCTTIKALNDKSLLTDEVVLTLVAIKILSTYYSEDKKLWSLVEKKARKFIQDKLALNSTMVQTLLDEFEPCFKY